MKKIITIIALVSLAGLGAACSKSDETSSNQATTTGKANTASQPAGANASEAGGKSAGAHSADEQVPPSIRAAFPDAQTITKQHKDIPTSEVAMIEREGGSKLPDTDHHSYLAFSTTGGARKQVGAATLVKAGGKELTVIYESRAGKPYIKEVRAEGVPQGFLDQLKGKGHDDKFQVGGDLKAQGLDEATAKAIATAIHIDILTMQVLYGGPDTH